MDQNLQDFIALCRNYSDAVDLIQAGGGNASSKTQDDVTKRAIMRIKASGFLMSEVDENNGYSTINLLKVQQLIEAVSNGSIEIEDEKMQNEIMIEANLSSLRPSIETYLHALLPQKHVLHLHSYVALLYASSHAFKEITEHQFDTALNNEMDMLYVGYEKPGIKLAMALKEKLEQFQSIYHKMPRVIILQNHGIIYAANSLEEIDDSVMKSEAALLNLMNLSDGFSTTYRRIFEIKKAMSIAFNDQSFVVRLNEDRDLLRLHTLRLSFPDAVVFCGPEMIRADNHLELSEQIEAYKHKYADFPKVILYKSALYFVATNIKKCLEIQDVLKIQFLLNEQLGDDLVTLSALQIAELLNWEAEKYRKKL
ncbi:class II aldolase/adducin family protein [Fusibacter bizertensis]